MDKYTKKYNFGMNKEYEVKYSELTNCFWITNESDGERLTLLNEDLQEMLEIINRWRKNEKKIL